MPLMPNDELPDRDAFVAYVRDLHQDFQQRGDEWENHNLGRFLEALAAWVNSAPNWYRNVGKDLPNQGDWAFFARALQAATVYE